MTLNWSRYLSLYQLGLGSRGIGFRDSSQDVMGALSGSPEAAKALLRKLLSVQLSNGSAMHQFYPGSMEADHGDAEEDQDDTNGKLIYGDDHLWIVPAVCAYLKETGETDFLNEEISFYQQGTPIEKRETATVLEHLTRALAYTQDNVGAHGIPLLGYADWNDIVHLPGPAESIFNACLYGFALLEMIELCEHLGLAAQAERYRADHATMKEVVNTQAWDGEWYLRYFTAEGEPIGSQLNEKGSLYTNAQSWPIIAQFAPPERAQSALQAVHDRHNTKFGIKLSSPGYDRYDPMIGGVTTYPPGAKENGGIFLHANPWVMIAETKLGRGDRAYQYHSQINPAGRNEDATLYEVEPYCYAQNILADEHPQFGLGRNSWLSGTASWNYQVATQHVLGVQPSYEGLHLDPCIPTHWPDVTVTRRFRNATYHIQILNPSGVSKGVSQLTLNGKLLTSTTIPLASEGVHKVVVTLGAIQNVAGLTKEANLVEA